MAAAKPKGKTPKKKPARASADLVAARKYMNSGAYNKTDGVLRKVKGKFADKLLGDTFSAAAGYTEDYAAFARANPGMVAPVDLGFGTYDPSTMTATINGKTGKPRPNTNHGGALGTAASSALGVSGAGAAVTAGAAPSTAAPWENIDLAGGGIPLTAEDLAAGPATGGKNKKGRKKVKKVVKKAKAKTGPGGSKVTAKERARIKAIKARNRGK